MRARYLCTILGLLAACSGTAPEACPKGDAAVRAAGAMATSTPVVPRSGLLGIVGGGGTPDEVVRALLAHAGGPGARVVVIPAASQRADAGEGAARLWTAQGATNVAVLKAEDAGASELIAGAEVIWFPGGDQERLMDALAKAGLSEPIRKRCASGIAAGGTSAGAAVMSAVMIAGGGGERVPGRVPDIEPGIGLLPEAIVDQHFTQRRRRPRLEAAVRLHPHLAGIGIDERTAILVTDDEILVVGEGTVTFLRAIVASEPGPKSPTEGPMPPPYPLDVSILPSGACVPRASLLARP